MFRYVRPKIPVHKQKGNCHFVCTKGTCGTLFLLNVQFCPPKRPLRDAFLAQNAILSAQKNPAGRPSVIPKTKYGHFFLYSLR